MLHYIMQFRFSEFIVRLMHLVVNVYNCLTERVFFVNFYNKFVLSFLCIP